MIITPKHGVLTLSGYGIGVTVERGHLIVKEGNGISRFSRVRHGLRRLVCIGSDGWISLAALEWLADAGASFVHLERNGKVLTVAGPVSPSDARLRRTQALAGQTGADLRIARELIRAKLAGQERIARDNLGNFTAAQAISKARTALDTATTIPAIRQLEAQAGLAYWSAWRAVPVNFPKADARKTPEHWKLFGTRISPVSCSPRCAVSARTWGYAVAPWAEMVARTLWTTIPKQSNRPGPATPLTGNHRTAGHGGEHTRPVVSPPRPLRICKTCGVECEKSYCACCGAVHSLEEFDKGRRVAQTPASRARRSISQHVHASANRTWKPSKEFAWLDRKTYISRIQPRLASITISALQSALGISEPYAAFIRAGSRIPHPRHWPALAKLVSVSS